MAVFAPACTGGAQALTFEVAGRDAYANACSLAPGDVTLACSPSHALTDVSITPNNSPSIVVVKATVACEGVRYCGELKRCCT